jgi:cytochrome c oxidase assembly factor 4
MVSVLIPTRRTNTLKSLPRDKRIFSTGCAGTSGCGRALDLWDSDDDAAENTKMNDCYYEKKDWRLCKNEVSFATSRI